MSVTLQQTRTLLRETSHTALVPALTSSLAQLQPAMQQTQESLQGLIVKVTDALARSEERGRKLEAELIAEKSQHAADKAAYEQRLETLESLIDTLQKTNKATQKRMTALEGQTKYIRPAIKAMVATGGSTFLELGYPGKKRDVALRKPVLEAAIRIENEALLRVPRGPSGPPERGKIQQRLAPLEAEAARIAAYEALEGKTKV